MTTTSTFRATAFGALLCALLANSAALADIRTWTGNGDGFSWEDAANWSGNLLPGPRDDVQINAGSGVVLFSARATVASFSSTRPFGMEGGSLTVTGGFTVNSASLTINGGVITGAPVLTNSTISIADSLVSPVTVIATGAGNTLTKLGSTLGTVILRGGAATGIGALAIPDEFVNGGVIRLELTSTGGWTSELVANGLFENGPAGTIETQGTGGNHRISGSGSFINDGTMSLLADEVFRVTTTGECRLRSGSVESANRLERPTNTLIVEGGTVTGELRATAGASLAILATITDPITVVVTGGANTLIANASTLGTVNIRGGSDVGNAFMFVADGLVNAGTIIHELTTTGGWTSGLVANGSFINGPTGVITTLGTGGDQQITGSGTFINDGTMNLVANGLYRLQQSGEVELRSGTINIAGVLQRAGGLLTVSGGVVNGTLRAAGVDDLRITNTLTSPIVVDAVGAAVTLIENASPIGTVRVLGGSDFSNGRIFIPDGFVNAGRILMELTTTGGWTVELEADGSFTNGPNGTIETLGTGGNMRIFGLGSFTNDGTLDLVADEVFRIQCLGPVELRAGDVNVVHRIERPNGFLTLSGGTLAGELRLLGTALLTIADSITSPMTVVVTGQQCVLLGNESPLGTIIVRGGSAIGNSRLIIDVLAAMAGTVQLDLASSGGWASELELLGNLTNGPTGVIEATGATGVRGIHGLGTFTNAGRLVPGRWLTTTVPVTFTPTSVFAVDIAGTAVGQFSRLASSSTVTVNGALEVTRSGGFVPSPGDQFEIVQANPRFGVFTSTLGCDVVSLSYSPTAVTLAFAPISSIVGDLNGDGQVDGADLGILLNNWGACAEQCCVADLTDDGAVDGADLGLLLNNWG